MKYKYYQHKIINFYMTPKENKGKHIYDTFVSNYVHYALGNIRNSGYG